MRLHADDDGGFWAEVPGLPGCVSEGDDEAETLANIREAAERWVAVATKRALKAQDSEVAEIEL